MKKFVLLIVVLFSLLGTVGCMNKNEISNSEVDKITSETSKTLTDVDCQVKLGSFQS